MCVGFQYNTCKITRIGAVCPLYVPRKGYNPHETYKVRFPPSVLICQQANALKPLPVLHFVGLARVSPNTGKNKPMRGNARKCTAFRLFCPPKCPPFNL